MEDCTKTAGLRLNKEQHAQNHHCELKIIHACFNSAHKKDQEPFVFNPMQMWKALRKKTDEGDSESETNINYCGPPSTEKVDVWGKVWTETQSIFLMKAFTYKTQQTFP